MLRYLAILMLMAGILAAQSFTLLTTLAGGNGQKGNMFDIVNTSTSSITVTSFDQNFWAAGTDNFEVWYATAGGGYAPVATNAAAWTLAGSTTGVVHGGPGTAVAIPIAVNVVIPAGATQAFFCTIPSSTTGIVAYTNGTAVGTVFASDPFIQFLQGTGNAYPIGSGSFAPRVWNGVIHYIVGGTIQPEWQVNQAGSSLDINGVQGTMFGKALSTVCTGATVTANFASVNTLMPFEVLLSPTASIGFSAGAMGTANGQLLNIGLGGPLLWLNGGVFMNFVPFPGTFAATFGVGTSPLTLSAQQIVVDPTNPDGFALSQAPQLDVTASGTQAITLTDDSAVAINLATNTICTPTSLTLYGTSYTQVQVISNGRLMFGAPNVSFTPSVAQALVDNPSFGIWTDFNPSAGGTMSASAMGGLGLAISWNAVPYFGSAIPNTFTLSLDAAGTVLFDTLNTLGVQTYNAWIGISRGNTGATDPGVTTYALGGPNAGPAGNGMIYNFGPATTITAGITQLMFLPNAGGNYDWAGF